MNQNIYYKKALFRAMLLVVFLFASFSVFAERAEPDHHNLVGQLKAGKTEGALSNASMEVYHGELFFVDSIRIINVSLTKDFYGGSGGIIGVALVDDRDSIAAILAVYNAIQISPLPSVSYAHNDSGSIDITAQGLELPLNHIAPVRVPATVSPGRYKLRVVYRPSGVNWVPMLSAGFDFIAFEFAGTSVDILVKDQTDITSKFTDPNFRAEVYRRIVKSDGDRIYTSDVANITALNVKNMGIGSLSGIEYFTALEALDCSNNNLTSLDVSRNAKLWWLGCTDNNLRTLNVTGNRLAMTFDDSGKDSLQEVGRSPNVPGTVLRKLYCSNNNLKMLDVTGLPIDTLECQNNYMVDESWIIGFPEGRTLTFSPQKTDITSHFIDDNFRAAVYEMIDKTPGEPILVSDVSEIGLINVNNKNIKSLAGIEHFVRLWMLHCNNNELTELDLSNNIALYELSCHYNELTGLNVSNNSQLTILGCAYNNLTRLDVSNNIKLIGLYCSNNKLTELDLSNNVLLGALNCSDNRLRSLKLPPQTAGLNAGQMRFSNNELTILDLSGYRSAYMLYCDNNRLTELKLPSGGVYLMDCSNNNLESLVLNHLIQYLNCQYNYMVNESAVIINFHDEWNDENLNFWPQKTHTTAITSRITETVTIADNTVHIVTFVDDSGEVIDSQLVQNGRPALPPQLAREGYTLTWDKEYSSVTESMTLMAQWVEVSAIKVYDRVTTPPDLTVVITPPAALQGEFTAGPNPVARSAGQVDFFRQGRWISDCELRIYDAFGNFINKLEIRDTTSGDQLRRQVGSWDLKDAKGRIVPEGTYLVRGVIKTVDGKRERVSVILGVK